jgi:hypothetical protein
MSCQRRSAEPTVIIISFESVVKSSLDRRLPAAQAYWRLLAMMVSGLKFRLRANIGHD